MNPSAARVSLIALSFVVLLLSGLVTTIVWRVLAPLDPLPRAMISLLAFVAAYYAGANLIFWKAVLRISPSSSSLPQQN
jgi:hypothetical protein